MLVEQYLALLWRIEIHNSQDAAIITIQTLVCILVAILQFCRCLYCHYVISTGDVV